MLFAFLRKHQNKAPMEALIGITYAGAIAVSLLVLEKSATGTEHIKEMLVGTILTVSWHDVLQLGAIVLAVAVIHWIARKRFFAILRIRTKLPGGGFAFGGGTLFSTRHSAL